MFRTVLGPYVLSSSTRWYALLSDEVTDNSSPPIQMVPEETDVVPRSGCRMK